MTAANGRLRLRPGHCGGPECLGEPQPTDRIEKIARHKRRDDGSHAWQCRDGRDQMIPKGRQETAVRLVEGRQHSTEELVTAHMHLPLP